jgi:hypothetical protein
MISLISVAHAAADNKAQIAAKEFVVKINDAILFPLIALMMALAFLFFLWGAFEYVKNAENQTARETGKRHLIYGVLGMFIMLSAYAILNIAAGTFGLEKELKNANDPITTLAPSVSRLPSSRPDFNAAGYVPADSTYWDGDTADSFGGDSGYIPYDDTPPDMITDIDLDRFGTPPDENYTLPDIPQGSDEFVFSPRPAQPLSPPEQEIFSRYVDTYLVQNLPGRTALENNVDEQNILNEYKKFGVTEIIFMTDAGAYGTREEAGAVWQQESLCKKAGGEMTLESGSNKVTSRSMYICLR